MKTILYVGWLGFHNLGDELMWEVFAELSRKHLDPKHYKVVPSLPSVDLQDVRAYDTVVLGGGSLLVPGYVNVAHRAVQANKQLVIWGSGYDSQVPLPSAFAGELPSGQWRESEAMCRMLVNIGNHAAYFGVRGPLSEQVMRYAGVAGKLFVSGDSGMLPSLPSIEKEADDAGKRPQIGINWGTSYNRIYGKNEARVEAALAETARAMIAEGYDIYLYTMWGPDREAIKRLYSNIGLPQHTVLDLELHGHQELMRRISRCQATINFKLHANVLSAAAGVPFVCLAYRFKCVDFAYSLDLPELAVMTDDPELAQKLVSCTKLALRERVAVREKMKKSRQEMTNRLQAPFLQGLFC